MANFVCTLEELPALLAKHAKEREENVKKGVRKAVRRVKKYIDDNAERHEPGDVGEYGRMPIVTGELAKSGKVEVTADGARLTFSAPYAQEIELGRPGLPPRHFVKVAVDRVEEILDDELKER